MFFWLNSGVDIVEMLGTHVLNSLKHISGYTIVIYSFLFYTYSIIVLFYMVLNTFIVVHIGQGSRQCPPVVPRRRDASVR